jgi:phosphate:Na+ symporter
MDWMYILFYVIGGLAVFIYGMQLLSGGLQKTAGARLKGILHKLTSNRLKGVAVGTVFTSLVQSSSLTTVTVVGLISGGVMTLKSAVPVIMGANIGTTVTAQIIAFKITLLAFPAMALGLILMRSKNRKYSGIGQVIMGFGMIFLGMILMSDGVSPLKDEPAFMDLLSSFASNPLLGLFAGMIFTALVQSSSATTALVVAMSSGGLISLASAIPLLLGANIGTCITAVLASLAATLSAKRAAMVHVMFNLFGVLIFLPLLPMFSVFIEGSSGDLARQVANAHLAFNLIATMLLLPLSGVFIILAKRLLPGEEIKIESGSKYINKNLLATPSLALEQAKMEAEYMGGIVLGMMKDARKLIFQGSLKHAQAIEKKEMSVDCIYASLDNFLKEINQDALSASQSKELSVLVHTISDIERTSDHINHLARHSRTKIKEGMVFSEGALLELDIIFEKSQKSLVGALEVMATNDGRLAKKVLCLEAEIDSLKEKANENHIAREKVGVCDPRCGPTFLSLVNNLERISDHAHNIVNVVTLGY